MTRQRIYCKCGCKTRLTGRETTWASEGCRKAFERGTAPANADTTRTDQRSGLQVSYRKAIETLHQELGLPKLAIEHALVPALSARQRERLEELESAGL